MIRRGIFRLLELTSRALVLAAAGLLCIALVIGYVAEKVER